jgi:hypothetical protein
MQRDRVYSHIVSHIAKRKPLMLFSMPGERWALEDRLAEKYARCSFIACERDVTTFEKCIAYMPGGPKKMHHHWFLDPPGKHIEVYETKKSRVFACDAEMFLVHSPLPTHWRKPENWKRCSLFNAVWIDSFSPFGSRGFLEIVRAVLNRGHGQRVAYAFSFLLGRDDPKLAAAIDCCPGETPIGRRANFIRFIAQQAGVANQISSVFSHRSFNSDGSVRIGTICGVVYPNPRPSRILNMPGLTLVSNKHQVL